MEIHELVKPAKALGFDAERLAGLNALLKRGVADKLFPAASYIVMRHGLIAAQGAFGVAQPDAIPPIPTTLDTIFDMASLTKTMTATLLLQCVEEGKVTLGQEVRHFLPEAEKSPVGALSLRLLATHTSGLPPWKALYKTKAPSALADIIGTDLAAEPGTKYAYSDLGYILLGEILHRVTEKPLNQLAQERIFQPLEMKHTAFRPDPAWRNQIAATANCPWRPDKILVGEVHDANAHSLNGVAGHAGLFSTVPDMARFALAFAYPTNAAHFHLRPALSLPAFRLASHSQVDPKVGGHTIGWFAPPNGMLPAGDLLSPRAFGHTGFTGTMMLFDPEYDLTLIFLTNRVYQPGEGTAVLRMRRLFSNIVAGAITA